MSLPLDDISSEKNLYTMEEKQWCKKMSWWSYHPTLNPKEMGYDYCGWERLN